MRIIRALSFTPDTIEIAYMDESDVRLEGQAYVTHSMSIARDRFADEIREVEEATQDLLREATHAWATSLPFDIEQALRAQTTVDNDEEDDDA